MKNKFYITLLFLVIFCPKSAFGSEFSFDTASKSLSIGQEFEVDLNINTEKENINAVSGKIYFPANLLDLSEIRIGNSVVNFWVDQPALLNGEIVFSGITPGGFILDKGFVLSLIFKTKKEGSAPIKITNASALLNDGNGTADKIKTSDLNLNISSSVIPTSSPSLNIADNEPPEAFKPEISRDPNIFDGKWFLSFAAEDKGSGIAGYEVKESRYFIFDFSKWVPATSPYVLADQDLRSYIYVKAIDKKGNTRIEKLSPQNPLPWYENIEVWFIIIMVISVACAYFIFQRRKNKK